MQQKERIRVLFLLTDVSFWKTENLYLAMLSHPRFDPVIGVGMRLEILPSQNVMSFKRLTEYLSEKKYPYKEMKKMQEETTPDIIFYDKPYDQCIGTDLWYRTSRKDSLFCFATYSFNTVKDPWAYDRPLHDHCWQIYFENNIPLEIAQKHSKIKGKNCLVTGLPFSDTLLMPKQKFTDPWRKQDKPKKRIIYAPHHSIDRGLPLEFSTFLQNAEIMLMLAEKYADKVQFAFKPHPGLYSRLYKYWGKQKIEDYYNRWKELDNCQFEDGDYVSLFKYSNAMIHDCCSFQVEYHYTHNPVLYLLPSEDDNDHKAPLNKFGQMAFDLHYKGVTPDDIESFIQNVINNVDPRKEERIQFYNDYLLPPNGNTACENIIKTILR